MSEFTVGSIPPHHPGRGSLPGPAARLVQQLTTRAASGKSISYKPLGKASTFRSAAYAAGKRRGVKLGSVISKDGTVTLWIEGGAQ
jgi:hypothetical protein